MGHLYELWHGSVLETSQDCEEIESLLPSASVLTGQGFKEG